MLAFYMLGIILCGSVGLGGFIGSLYGMTIAESEYVTLLLMILLISCIFIGGSIFCIIAYHKEKAKKLEQQNVSNVNKKGDEENQILSKEQKIYLSAFVGAVVILGTILYIFTERMLISIAIAIALGFALIKAISYLIANGPSAKTILIFIVTILVIVGIVLLFVFLSDDLSNSSNTEPGHCIICDKKATNTFQGSEYCKKHYDEAVKWAIDNLGDN